MRKNSEAGFTLLEILLAIMVLSIMMMLVFDMSNKSTDTVDRVMTEDREYMQVQMAFSIIDRDFLSLYTPLFTEVIKKQLPGEEREDKERFNGITHLGKVIPVIDNPDKHELIFMTYSNQRRLQDLKQSNYAWVRYTLRAKESDDKKKNGSFELIRQFTADNPYGDAFEWDKIKSNVLLSNVEKFQFFFWSVDKEEYVESLTDLSEKQQVARLMKANLTWVNQNGFKIETSKTFRTIWPTYDASKEAKELLSSNSEASTKTPFENDTNEKDGDEEGEEGGDGED